MAGRALTCSVTDFQASPAAFLRVARKGDSVAITSRKKVVARLVPADAPAASVVVQDGSPWVDEEPVKLTSTEDISDLVQKYR